MFLVFFFVLFFVEGFRGDEVVCHGDNSLQPAFTGESFCTTTTHQKIFTCCHGPSQLALLPNNTELELKILQKFELMQIELNYNLKDCPNSPLTQEIIKSLETLQTFPWQRLIKQKSQNCNSALNMIFHCPDFCVPLPLKKSKPCANTCQEVVDLCWGDLNELEKPWKHAVDSVRASTRMILVRDECQGLGDLVARLEKLRDSFPWKKESSSCEHFSEDCWAGSYGGDGLPNTQKNPNSPWKLEQKIQKNHLTLEKLILSNIVKNLDPFWPNANSKGEISMETNEDYSSEEYLEESSGSGNNNYGDRFLTDDEDLLNAFEGSGNNSDFIEEIIIVTSGGSSILFGCHGLFFVLFVLLLELML